MRITALLLGLAILTACSSPTPSCFGGCACFTTKAACAANGCPYGDAGCYNGPTPKDGAP